MFHPKGVHKIRENINILCAVNLTDLVLLRLKLAITCLLRECFALSGDGSETLSTDILDDRCNQAIWCRNSN